MNVVSLLGMKGSINIYHRLFYDLPVQSFGNGTPDIFHQNAFKKRYQILAHFSTVCLAEHPHCHTTSHVMVVGQSVRHPVDLEVSKPLHQCGVLYSAEIRPHLDVRTT